MQFIHFIYNQLRSIFINPINLFMNPIKKIISIIVSLPMRPLRSQHSTNTYSNIQNRSDFHDPSTTSWNKTNFISNRNRTTSILTIGTRTKIIKFLKYTKWRVQQTQIAPRVPLTSSSLHNLNLSPRGAAISRPDHKGGGAAYRHPEIP